MSALWGLGLFAAVAIVLLVHRPPPLRPPQVGAVEFKNYCTSPES
jgi:hypothetical protein